MTLSSVNPKVADSQSLFRQVVTLDYWRILSRLRSKHAKITRRTKDKPILIKLLCRAMHNESIKAGSKVTHRKLEEIRTRVDDLNSVFDKFENITDHQAKSSGVQDTSMDLIRQAYELALLPELRDVLGSSQDLDPGLKTFLPEAIGKVGKYYGASLELVAAARYKAYSVFNHVMVKTVNLQGPAKRLGPDNTSTLLDSAENVIQPKGPRRQKKMARSIETYLSQPLAVIEQKFQSRIVQTEALKVHAEIQLLLFYEMHSELPRPRVICSSKSACYLCDLFIRMHGAFTMPRTHGRIYDKWTLPDFKHGIPTRRQGELGIVVEQFNAALETKIRLTLNDKRIPFKHPNESVLIPNAHWSPSTSSVISELRPSEAPSVIHPSKIRIANLEEHIEVPPDPSPSSKTISVRKSNSTICSSRNRSKDETCATGVSPETIYHSAFLHKTTEMLSNDSIVKHQPSRDLSITSIQHQVPEHTPSTDERLIRGQSIRKQLSHPIQVVRVGTDSVHLNLSREIASSDDVAASKRCWVDVRSLDTYEQLQISNKDDIWNLGEMADGLPTTTTHGGALMTTNLYLQVGQEILSIKFSYDEPPQYNR